MPMKHSQTNGFRSGDAFEFHDASDYGKFRDVLHKHGFTEKNILSQLKIDESNAIREKDTGVLEYRTRDASALNTLVRLFLIELPCSKTDVRKALAPMPVEPMLRAGLLEVHGEEVEAAVKLLPFRDLMIAFDRRRILRSPFASNYVMGIGQSTITLMNMTVRNRCGNALDLGCGCGTHALVAAGHCGHVTALDINPRAVALAKFNVRLNGLPNVDCLEGDLFEPVEGRRFDLIVTNPPFVISPESRYIYRDGGLPGDELCRRIVEKAPIFLNDGGICQILCNWAEPADRDWGERLKSWFENSGCNAWVLRSETRDVATYASTWIRHTEKADQARLQKHFDEWMAYYDRCGIETIGAGIVMFRKKCNGNNWFSAEDAPDKMLGDTGGDIPLGFALREYLHGLPSDSQLLSKRFRCATDVRLERICAPTPDGWADETFRLFMNRGLAYSGTIDAAIANVVVRCNGSRPVGDLLSETAAALDQPADTIAPDFCNIIRILVRNGILLPVTFIE